MRDRQEDSRRVDAKGNMGDKRKTHFCERELPGNSACTSDKDRARVKKLS
jgi:hypothetical protein